MDWQTIVVYVCPLSCKSSSEEFVFVQPPDLPAKNPITAIQDVDDDED